MTIVSEVIIAGQGLEKKFTTTRYYRGHFGASRLLYEQACHSAEIRRDKKMINRCQAGPEVYADVGMPTNDSALVPDLDAAVDGTDSAIVDMTTADDALVSASDATVNQADSALVDMMVSQDASSLDMSPQGDASLVSDGEVNLDEQDASSQDATL